MSDNKENLEFAKERKNKKSNKGIVIFIISVSIIFIALITTICIAIGRYTVNKGISLPKIENIIDLESLLGSPNNEKEMTIYQVKEVTDEDNVFKIETDLSSYLTLNEEEEVNLYPFKNEEYKYGYMNDRGEVIIEPQFSDAYNFKDGMAIVVNNYRYGYINSSGKVVIEPKYDLAMDFEYGLAIVKVEEDNYLVIDKSGNEILRDELDNIYILENGIIEVKGRFSTKYYRSNGERINIPSGYEIDYVFKNGSCMIVKDDEYLYLDNEDNIIKIDGYKFYKRFDNIFITLKGEDSYYYKMFATEDLKPIYLKDQYYNLSSFKGGDEILCVVMEDKEDRYQYIDATGKKLFSSPYEMEAAFIKGATIIYSENGYKLMNDKGDIISKKYDYIEQTKDGHYIVQSNNKYGVLNNLGEVIIPVERYRIYDEEECFVAKDEEYKTIAIYDSNGEKIEEVGNVDIIDSKVMQVRNGKGSYYYNLQTGQVFK